VQDVFIIGSKGLGNYGGYETFVMKLIDYHSSNQNIRYHIACKANGTGCMDEKKLPGAKTVSPHHFKYRNAICYKVPVKEQFKSAQAIFYDIDSLKWAINHIKKHHIEHPIVYVLACRIGPFFEKYVKEIHQLGGKVFVNPDGHEWMRAKWSKPVRKYWNESERLMVKHADLLVCDSVNIEKYIQESYASYHPHTTYIAYGADVKLSTLSDDDEKYVTWLNEHGLTPNNYYLIVGRFVPENNFETMIREFMKSHSKRDLAIVTTKNDEFLHRLDERLHWSSDPRIKFVGTVYDSELLKKIRENAYGYLHGHSVGGTNPSLLEALGSTKLNLLYDVGFNHEVGEDAALYWNLDDGNLAALIDRADNLRADEIEHYGNIAKKRITDAYSWQFIADEYQKLWLGELK
jgi:rhamnosyltransferase